MADRFYSPDPPVEGRIVLEGDEARHLARVRRVGPGCVVEVFDGKGFASVAEVVSVGRDRVELALAGEPLPERAPPCRLTLATAIPKGERFDWLVEKATELGVACLIPLVTERSVVDPRETKLARLRRLTIEASKQCGRSRLLEIEPPVPLPRLIAESVASVRVLAHPRGFPPARWPRIPVGGSAVLAIGPEGGFTEQEIALARESGWTLGDLGTTLLRIETAGLAGGSLLLALCGDDVE
ncbi:MAG: RsmE family RNA methyltransferase [Isosphaeraceae bacterium]|nr:RsmE family RNA methyltransferase [Isosphaeraceae bacterium]